MQGGTIHLVQEKATNQSIHEQGESVVTHPTPAMEKLARAAHLMKLGFLITWAKDLAQIFPYTVIVIVCSLARRLHNAGDDDLERMMLSLNFWRLATRSTRRLHGAKMSIIGMAQIANSSSIADGFLLGFEF
jgi:hypothetical protein